LRFIGDRRSINEKDFGIVQKDRSKELERWSDEFSMLNDHAKFAVIAATITMLALVQQLQTPLERWLA